MFGRSVFWLFVLALASSRAAFGQNRASQLDRMPKGTLRHLQEFLDGKTGKELAVLDPSLVAIEEIDPDNDFQRDALSMLASKLGDKDAFEAELEDPDKAQLVALKIVRANRDPENLAFVSAKVTERLAQLEGLGKKDRAKAAAELAPLVKFARPIRELAGLIDKARETADALQLSKEIGLVDEGVYVDEGDSSIVWRPVVSIGPMGQFGTGKLEVGFKEGRLGAMGKKELRAYLLKHPIPVFRGPKGKLRVYKHLQAPGGGSLPMDDHHHLLDALYRLGVDDVATKELQDGAGADADLEKHVYPFDQWGVRHALEELPRSVRGLGDFPFRSVAWLVRDLGGFEKKPVPYLEMYAAEIFRQNAKTHPNVDLYQSVTEALEYARGAKFKDWFQHFVESHR